MPLRDHFQPPSTGVAAWESPYGAWPGVMTLRLNELLPPAYRCGLRIHLGTRVELTDELTPPEYEVLVYDEAAGHRLVAAVELVSPRNKDRPESRDAFVSKCHALLQAGVCVAIVDPVTERSANLYALLAARLGAAPPAVAAEPLYAVACRTTERRGKFRVEAWEHALAVGRPLPTLPLWLDRDRYVPLELEQTYEATCRGLRIP